MLWLNRLIWYASTMSCFCSQPTGRIWNSLQSVPHWLWKLNFKSTKTFQWSQIVLPIWKFQLPYNIRSSIFHKRCIWKINDPSWNFDFDLLVQTIVLQVSQARPSEFCKKQIGVFGVFLRTIYPFIFSGLEYPNGFYNLEGGWNSCSQFSIPRVTWDFRPHVIPVTRSLGGLSVTDHSARSSGCVFSLRRFRFIKYIEYTLKSHETWDLIIWLRIAFRTVKDSLALRVRRNLV